VGVPDCPFCDSGSIEQEQRYVEIPVTTRFVVLDKKTDVYIDAGFTGNFLLPNDEKKNKYTESLNKFMAAARAGAGVRSDLGKRFDVSFGCAYGYSFTNMVKNNDFKLRAFSITTAVSYRL
jgi:hypothetical protein